MKRKGRFGYFSIFEICLWVGSVILIVLSSLFGGGFPILSLIASLVGVTALLFIAKGNVVGQFLCIIFACLYAVISWEQRYYGELITYLFMSLPSAVIACITWLKNPSKQSKNEVQVATVSAMKLFFILLGALLSCVLFYFILAYFHTNNLLVSTVSVATSFLASALLIVRSRLYAVAYALNDIVLIVLWTYSTLSSLDYLPMVVCFVAFLCNDLYAFYNWKRIEKRQSEQVPTAETQSLADETALS